eukprot:Skav215159  [mRNA]  locus=scaffold1997:137245:141568:+ [translate_table: standard]
MHQHCRFPAQDDWDVSQDTRNRWIKLSVRESVHHLFEWPYLVTEIGWDDYGQFGDHRTAVFLMPGEHEAHSAAFSLVFAAIVDIQLPYYFQVLGLGAAPTDTVVKPGDGGIGLEVGRQPGNLPNTNTFWRSIENVEVPKDLNFFVSQAAPLRKVKVHGNLFLSAGGLGSYAAVGCVQPHGAPFTTSYDFEGNHQPWQSAHTGAT